MTRQAGLRAQRAEAGQVDPGRRGRSLRPRQERGAALVEFSIVAILLFTLILGVLVFGLLLSKKQTVVQSANEAARAVVPFAYDPADGTGGSYVDIQNAAKAQINTSLSSTDRSCSDGHTVCDVVINRCVVGATTGPFCVFVNVTLDNKNHPVAPRLPFLSSVNPDTLGGQASAQLTTS